MLSKASKQVKMKNVVNCLKAFFLYFSTVKTYREVKASMYVHILDPTPTKDLRLELGQIIFEEASKL